MKISKSKRQLAQLLIEAGVTQFPKGANWAAQGSADLKASFYGGYKPKRGLGESAFCGVYCGRIHDIRLPVLTTNWHQTVLSRAEFDHIVDETAPNADGWIEWHGRPESPVDEYALVDVKMKNGTYHEAQLLSDECWSDVWGDAAITHYRLHKRDLAKPTAVGDDETNLAAKEELEALEFTPTPTLDQLLQDWRNADDYAKRKRAEADEAAAMCDERWQAVQARAGEFGLAFSPRSAKQEDECELVITDWRDLQVGDIIEYVDGDIKEKNGMTGPVIEFAPEATDGMHVRLRCDNGQNEGRFGWPRKWRFIRRP